MLEQRHSELENVLERLTTAVECGLAKPREHSIEVEEVSLGSEEDDQEKSPVAEGEAKETEAEKTERGISRSLIIDLFVEFQHKIRDFAQDLNGLFCYRCQFGYFLFRVKWRCLSFADMYMSQ